MGLSAPNSYEPNSYDYLYAYNQGSNSFPAKINENKGSVGKPINPGTPINLQSAGVLHTLEPVDQPQQNTGNRKLILAFGLFGFAILLAAFIGSVVYMQKKRRSDRSDT